MSIGFNASIAAVFMLFAAAGAGNANAPNPLASQGMKAGLMLSGLLCFVSVVWMAKGWRVRAILLPFAITPIVFLAAVLIK